MHWGKLDDAIVDFTKAIETNPSDVDAYYYRGKVRQRKKDIDGAIADFTKAIELEPNNDLHYHLRGWAKYAKGDHTGALADFTNVIEMDPKDAEACFSRGRIKFLTSDLDGAIADYTQAIALKPNYADAYRARSEAKAAKNDIEGQLADLNKTIEYDGTHAKDFKDRTILRLDKDIEGAKADVARALTLAPLDPELHFVAAMFRYLEKDYAGVIPSCSRAIELSPKYGIAFAWRAYARSEMEDFAGAASDAQRAMQLGVQNAYTYVASARAKVAKGDIDGAIIDYSHALSDDSLPKGTIYFARAQCRDTKKQYTEAIADYTKVIELNPKHQNAYGLRSWARFNSNDIVAALNDCDEFIKISGEHADAYSYVQRGIILKRKGDYNEAIAAHNKAIAIDPRCSAAYLNRGRTLAEQGRREAALGDFTTAIGLNQQAKNRNYLPYYERGRNLVYMGDAKGALADLAVALEINPNYASAIWFRAAAKLMNGETGGACYDFRLFLKQRPENTPTTQLLLFLYSKRDRETIDSLKTSAVSWKDDWERVIAQFLVNDIHESLFFALAEKGDATTIREHQCEAFYYAGMVRLLEGDKDGAKSLFEKCTALGVKNFVEHGFATAELARLKAKPKVY